jgi:putative flavoprotein involved in K+ transport
MDGWLPSEPARLNLATTNVTSVLWATGYRLDFSILDIPVLDEWNYPRHHRRVTEHPGLYAVGLPWLTGHGSSIVAGVGRDAEYLAQHIAGNIAARRREGSTVATPRKARRSPLAWRGRPN